MNSAVTFVLLRKEVSTGSMALSKDDYCGDIISTGPMALPKFEYCDDIVFTKERNIYRPDGSFKG